MLSLPHIVIICVIALVIFGPEKLPELARMVGKAMGELRKMTSDFRFTLEEEVRNLERQNRIRESETQAAPNPATMDQNSEENSVPRPLPEENVAASASPDLPPQAGQDIAPAPEAQEVIPPPEKLPDGHPAA